jgi:hypothetical protein
MQEHIMREKAESIRTIKIYSISLTLTADNRSQVVEKCHQIGNCRFSSGEAMLISIKFSTMRNMIMNSNNLKKSLRIEMGLQLLVAVWLPLLTTGTTAASFHAAGKYC